MVRTLCIDKNGIRKGAWSKEEDYQLRAYIQRNGHPNWRQLPKDAGLSRSGKSCRLRWMNYLRPGLNKRSFNQEEEELIVQLHEKYGNKWAAIAAKLPGRTDNSVKNFWHGHVKKRLVKETKATLNCNSNEHGIDPLSQSLADEQETLDAGTDEKPVNLSNYLEIQQSSTKNDSDGSTLSSFAVDDKQQNIDDKVDFSPALLSTFWTEPFVLDGEDNMSFYPTLAEEEFLHLSTIYMDNEIMYSLF